MRYIGCRGDGMGMPDIGLRPAVGQVRHYAGTADSRPGVTHDQKWVLMLI